MFTDKSEFKRAIEKNINPALGKTRSWKGQQLAHQTITVQVTVGFHQIKQ